MTWGKFDESENKAVPAGWQINPAYEIQPGDILVSRANTRDYVGAPVLVGKCRPRLLLSDKSLRLVPNDLVSKKWLVHMLGSPGVRGKISETATGTKDSMRNISQQALLDIDIPLPPLAEQHRIVEALEAQLSRLDAAVATVKKSLRRLTILRKSVLLSLVPEGLPEGWASATVEQAGKVELGRARHPDWHHGPEMRPYLRVANVFEDRIDTSDVMEMDFSGIFEKYRLHPGDVLLNEGQSPHLVGRPALYRGTPPNVAFTNSILRFKARADVMPEWALMVFRRHLHAKRFMREVRITTNIAHLSSKRLKRVEFPIPPMDVQEQLVQRCDELLSGVDAMSTEAELSLVRAAALRSAILNRAFTGGLVPQDPTAAPTTELLAQIQAERAAQPKPQRARRAKKATVLAPAPEPTDAPATAVQQEFEL